MQAPLQLTAQSARIHRLAGGRRGLRWCVRRVRFCASRLLSPGAFGRLRFGFCAPGPFGGGARQLETSKNPFVRPFQRENHL